MGGTYSCAPESAGAAIIENQQTAKEEPRRRSAPAVEEAEEVVRYPAEIEVSCSGLEDFKSHEVSVSMKAGIDDGAPAERSSNKGTSAQRKEQQLTKFLSSIQDNPKVMVDKVMNRRKVLSSSALASELARQPKIEVLQAMPTTKKDEKLKDLDNSQSSCGSLSC
eukprot:TRINITY_DN74042_c0_g1_i1.p1 TRINITY_DN74042_c0_g1~~TRINITY_DN74042_c0_g1_i1.p1  ORF type:complete len:165 (+),score=40.17 TRINITY_DN74042_c0_g1_i1:135-629(+)